MVQRGHFAYYIYIPHICHFFTQAKFLENKIYTEICLCLPKRQSFSNLLTDCLFDGFSWSDAEKEEEGLGKGKGRYLAI